MNAQQQYPAMRYHPNGKQITVRSAEEDARLSEDWMGRPYAAPQILVPAAPPALSDCPNCQRLLQAYTQIKARYERLSVASEEAQQGHKDLTDTYEQLLNSHQALMVANASRERAAQSAGAEAEEPAVKTAKPAKPAKISPKAGK